MASASGAAPPAPLLASVFEDEEEVNWSELEASEIAAKIKKERDEVDEAALSALGKMQTREALDILLAAYDQFASTYMRREVLFALPRFDGVDDCAEPALQKLMDVALTERKRELREAGLRGLGRSSKSGKPFLEKIITSTAGDTLRERALAMHIAMGDDADQAFYKSIYERTMKKVMDTVAEAKQKKNRTKRERDGLPDPEISWPTGVLRSTAMEAIMESLDDGALVKAFEDDKNMVVRRQALVELANRGHKKASEYARQIVGRVDNAGTARALAARILVDIEGGGAAKELIKIAIQTATPVVFSQQIADMLADLKDEAVDKQLQKLLGKGRVPQQAFAIRATKYIKGDKFLKKMRKGLTAKKPELVAATALALAARKDRESIEAMEKVLEKAKSEETINALLESLSILYDGENAWLSRLETYTDNESDLLRNGALTEIARIGRSSSVDLMKERLAHPVWSTRLIALGSLAKRRDVALLQPIVAQMQNEVGRMQLLFGDVLFQLTGQPFGRRANVWQRWLEDQGGKVQLMSEAEVKKLEEREAQRRLKEISAAAEDPRFFGIQIVSERVLFIIDVSGSMAAPLRPKTVSETPPTRMELAKKELMSAIDSLPDGALFNIAPFSGSVMTWLDDGVQTATEEGKVEAKAWVSRLDAAGGTALYDALVFAFDDENVDTIYLLSDGEPSVGDLIDPQLIRDDIAERNKNRGIEINSIAVGTGLQVLEWLAEDSGGIYIEIQ